MTVAEVASFTGATPPSTAKLGDLERDRFVRKAKIPGTDQRTTYYEIREPLLRHCLDLKRTAGRPLALIVEVLRGWYEGSELRELLAAIKPGTIAERYVAEATRLALPFESGDRMWSSGAIDDLLTELRARPRGSASTRAAIEAVAVLVRDGEKKAREVLGGNNAHWTGAAELTTTLRSLVESTDRIASTARKMQDSITEHSNPLYRIASAVVAASEGDPSIAAALPSEQRRLAQELIAALPAATGPQNSANSPSI